MILKDQDRELAARTHLAYRYILRKCLSLTPSDKKALITAWNCDESTIRQLGFRSAPQSDVQKLFLEHYAEKYIDLRGVPGFYVSLDEETHEPRWRFNAPAPGCILRPFYDRENLIRGILVYRRAIDTDFFLLSSKGMWAGTKAVPFDPLRHH
jgi:hypothetical protein